jgi:deoxyadenosine/deoxycytidine kinase
MSGSRYIAIEGVIGVGKTSLANLLATRLGARLVLEEVEENPFLTNFYQDRRAYAFQTQVFFLLSRYRQQQTAFHPDLFTQSIVSDYIFAKDKIFAYLNLDDNEISLYERLLSLVERNIPRPDLVVYLQADVDRLAARVKGRGRAFEREMPKEYLQELVEAYNHFFLHYSDTPLLVVNTNQIDFVNSRPDFEDLVRKIGEHQQGTRYYVPTGRR